MANFDSFFNAIAGQESGGNYSAVNSNTGAIGKYQIMPGNIVPWSRQYLGFGITPQQFEDSPTYQDQLARAVLEDYYGKWGPEGAASAWYSGSPTKWQQPTNVSNGPSVAEYVKEVMGRMGTSGASVAGATQSTPQSGSGLLNLEPTSNMFSSSGTNPSLSLTPELHDVAFLSQASNALNAPAQIKPGASSVSRDKMIAYGMSLLGTPYVWGGTSPTGGMDCSGFMQVLYKSIGINLPRVSFQQATAGQKVAISQLQPGDLVAFNNSVRNAGADHIAMWLGNNQILEEPHTGAAAQVATLNANELNDPNVWGVHFNLPGD